MFLPSLAGGGAESASLRIATALVDRGHQVDLLTARVDQAPNNRPDERLRYSTLGHRHTRSAIRDLAGHLRTTRPDVLVTAMDPANVAGLVAARMSGTRVPVVVTFHSDIVAASRRSRNLFSHVRPAVARWTIRQADHVVAISKGVRASLDELARPGAERRSRRSTTQPSTTASSTWRRSPCQGGTASILPRRCWQSVGWRR